MGRKHGGINTPLRPKMTSNSAIFERRGDPFVSPREQLRDYGRDVENENSDYDFDRRFHHSNRSDKVTAETIAKQEAEKLFQPKPYKKRNALDTPEEKDIPLQLRATQLALKMHRQYPSRRIILTAKELVWIACPKGCGLKFRDSFAVSRHLRDKACKRK